MGSQIRQTQFIARYPVVDYLRGFCFYQLIRASNCFGHSRAFWWKTLSRHQIFMLSTSTIGSCSFGSPHKFGRNYVCLFRLFYCVAFAYKSQLSHVRCCCNSTFMVSLIDHDVVLDFNVLVFDLDKSKLTYQTSRKCTWDLPWINLC